MRTRPTKSLKIAKRTLILLAILFALFVLWLAGSGHNQKGNIAVFVVDSTQGMHPESRKKLDFFQELKHGQVVCDILGRSYDQNKLKFYNVDDALGRINQRRYFSAISEITEFARKNPDCRVLVNLSFGSKSGKQAEQEYIEELSEAGAIIIAAAGNDGLSEVSFPAAYKQVIAVGACAGQTIASYSNRGKQVDIYTMGIYKSFQAVSFVSHRGFEKRFRNVTLYGTSFASPRVTGLIAELVKFKPDLSKARIIQILHETSDPITGSQAGSVNHLKALARVSGRYRILAFLGSFTGKVLFVSLLFIAGGIIATLLFQAVYKLTEALIRIIFPKFWMDYKINRINRILSKRHRSPGDFRYIIACLRADYPAVYRTAQQALLAIGQPSVEHLIKRYDYASRNQFVDFKTPIETVLSKIGGPQAEEFLEQIGFYEKSDS